MIRCVSDVSEFNTTGIILKYLTLYNKYHIFYWDCVFHWHSCCSEILPYPLFQPYKHLFFDGINEYNNPKYEYPLIVQISLLDHIILF